MGVGPITLPWKKLPITETQTNKDQFVGGLCSTSGATKA